ncbi:MAG: PKD domain-containing protein [Candidatus Hydrogenedentes bacterium]|nr:PKD domain-containing protein [Candidatus Hydrogenedentota bacterium]
MRIPGMVLAGLLTLASGCQFYLPIANLEASVTEGDLPLEVTFQDVSKVGGQPILSWRWDFGDGNVSTAMNPVHSYTERGVYAVSLEVETPWGTDDVLVENLITVREVIRFPDTNLDAALRVALNRDVGSIRVMDLEALSTFDGSQAEITSLSGLEHAVNLEQLFLNENSIVDISPLSTMAALSVLSLRDNQVADLDPLSELTTLLELDLGINNVTDIRPLAALLSLELLNLERNGELSDIRTLQHLTALRELSLAFTGITQNEIDDGAGNGDGLAALIPLRNLTFLDMAATDISDLSALAGLSNLEALILFECLIEDISPLANLVNLQELQLSANGIIDVSALAGLEQLDILTLQMNQIASIAPLVLNQGLGNNDVLRLTGNPLDSTSLCSAVPTLELRGVIVELDQSCTAR